MADVEVAEGRPGNQSSKPTRREIVLEKERRGRRWLYRLLPRYQFSNDRYEALIGESMAEGTIWLDLGCGRNDLVQELAKAGVLAVGIDAAIHPHLRRSEHPFIKADVSRLPLKDASVHLLSGNMLLEHLADPLAALREMQRILRPGGKLILRTPNSIHPVTLLARLLPDGLKTRLIERIFGVPSTDVFPTLYRANRLGKLHRLCREAGFADVQIHAIEDVHTAFGFFFMLSLAYYLLVRLSPLAPFRSNFVLLAAKDR
jgi:ubiquinone/menaquinone biosynthesis C-methylase UbiE